MAGPAEQSCLGSWKIRVGKFRVRRRCCRGRVPHGIPNDGLEEDMTAPLIQLDPNVMMGMLVVAGSRIPVDPILEKRPAGKTAGQPLGAFSRPTREGIRAALQPVEHGAAQDDTSVEFPLLISERAIGGHGGA